MLDSARTQRHPLVAASILSADFGRMAVECRQVLELGVDLLHVDVMDGHFVPNLTMGADMIAALRRHLPEVFLDVHLMVERPGDYIESFARAGADVFTFHVECIEGVSKGRIDPLSPERARDLIASIRQAGMKVGMALNPPTDVVGMEPWLDQLDLALVMSVNPGRSGQSFMPEVLDKARWLASRLPDDCGLEIDGGISPRTAPDAVEAGVQVLVSASALFGAADRTEAIAALRNAGCPARFR